jgi:N-formylglutamate deformylase
MNNDALFTLFPGTTPLLVSVPHAGRRIPRELQDRLVPRALDVEDTDWHLEQLYDFVRSLGAGLIVPQHSRYVVDLNRPPENTPMYAGSNNTELCPTRFFTGDPLYREGQAPGDAEIARRVQTYWRPYHDALRQELDRLRAVHGHAVLFDGHSIKSELPWLFEGKLPDLNLGTANGAACDPGLQRALGEVLVAPSPFTHVINGRFKGGHITRHYGQPAQGFHAVQLEMCWSTYMQESAPYTLYPQRVAQITPVLRGLVQAMLAWRPDV